MNGDTPTAPLVLLVEDHWEARELTADLLRAQGFRVETADDGPAAVELARDLQPCVVVLDLTLPILSGWQVLARLREEERTRDTPVVIMSGHPRAHIAADLLAHDCDAFVQKPYSAQEMVREIQRVLASKPGKSETGAPRIATPAAVRTPSATPWRTKVDARE